MHPIVACEMYDGHEFYAIFEVHAAREIQLTYKVRKPGRLVKWISISEKMAWESSLQTPRHQAGAMNSNQITQHPPQATYDSSDQNGNIYVPSHLAWQ